MLRAAQSILLSLLLSAFISPAAIAQTGGQATPSSPTSATQAQPLDVNAAVEFYLAKMPPSERARSNSYFEGGYWLQLWDFLIAVALMSLLLGLRWSAAIRNLSERLVPWRWLQPLPYWILFLTLTSALTFPMTLYEGYFREKKYGFMNQTFGAWMKDQLVGLAVGAILGAVLIVLLFLVVRWLGRSWWIWGAVLMTAFLAFVSLIAPVYIFPLFNTYTKLQDARIKDPILSMTRANGIPATDVYEFDASRQSDRVSANVSGFASTLRISLNDNLLKRCTLPEIETTMGHEMGHYVLNHGYKGLIMEGVLTFIGFAFVNWGMLFALARWGQKWDIDGITDIAVLPLAFLLFTVFAFVTTPIGNTITRTMEFEADMYGLNAARQPDGEANVDLMLGEYRKMDPGPVEEFMFFDHPSGRTRITAAMRWKAEHPETTSEEEMARKIFDTK